MYQSLVPHAIDRNFFKLPDSILKDTVDAIYANYKNNCRIDLGRFKVSVIFMYVFIARNLYLILPTPLIKIAVRTKDFITYIGRYVFDVRKAVRKK